MYVYVLIIKNDFKVPSVSGLLAQVCDKTDSTDAFLGHGHW